MNTSLSTLTNQDSVDNVLVFISDSLRDDFLPESVEDLGVRMHAIAPSTFTASSMPSILTGTYPAEHKVWNFSNRLPEKPYILSSALDGGINVDNVWGDDYSNEEKPTLSLLRSNENTRFKDLKEPFTFIVHDHGGHSPYGKQDGQFKNSREFFEEHADEPEKIIAQYRSGVSHSVERFFNLYERLQEESLLDNTLLVFTSDHGELLGEYGGLYEHTAPMVPELLKIPLVFCGAGLSTKSLKEPLVSSIDIAPTLLSAQGREIPSHMDGFDLWDGVDSDRIVRADAWRKTRFGEKIRYQASSVWDQQGGVVVHRGSQFGRIAYAIGTNLHLEPHSVMVRRRPLRNTKSLIRVFGPNTIEFGIYKNKTNIQKIREMSFCHRDKADNIEPDKEKLEALGYIE